jgi:hypothetical protein
MTSQYRHRRTSNPATAFPNPIEPGEIAVNTANRQLAVGDAQSGVTGTPLPLLPLRFFDARAIYAIGDMVYEGGVVYRANVACGPETFTPAHWDILAGAIDPLYVQRSGDTMAGFLTLHANPTAAMHAATKQFVDAGLAGKSVVIASPTPPTGVPDNTLWWSSDEGVLLIRYNDGSGPPQWVITSPQPDPGTFIAKAGDTMTGLLVLSGDPVTPLGAATGQYAIAMAAAAANTRVNKTGDAMTGPLSIPIAPLTNSEVTNKLYVDSAVNAKSSTVISDTPPAGAPDGTIWYESDSGLTYVRYNDGNSSQWVALLSTAGNAVLYDAQTLTVTQAAQARTNISAAPFDAMAYNGMQVNGAMEVSQEKGTTATSVTQGAAQIIDSWKVWSNGAGFTVAAYQDKGNVPAGYPASIQMSVTVPTASPPSGSFCAIVQTLEGYRTCRLGFGAAGASPLTVGFWVMAQRAGQYSVALYNGDGTRSCPKAYTVNNANVFEYKTVTFPGDITGTWTKENAGSLTIAFPMFVESAACGPADVWSAALKLGVVGGVGSIASTSEHLLIAGVVALPGLEAPSAARAPFIMRPFDQELVTCQRYYEKDYDYGTPAGSAIASSFIEQYIPVGIGNCQGFYVPHKTRKRAAPTLTIFSTTGASGYITGITSGQKVVNIDSNNEGGYSIYANGAPSDLYRWHHVADARL